MTGEEKATVGAKNEAGSASNFKGDLKDEISGLEQLLSRKKMEVEILKTALAKARSRTPTSLPGSAPSENQ